MSKHIQALERERYLADSWMKLTKSLIGNMKLIFNNSFSFTKTDEVEDNLQMLSAVELEPSNLTINQFWGHPASSPLWKFARTAQFDTRNTMWESWWASKVNSTWKITPKKRLANYLTALDYYNQQSEQFFGQMAFNPTCWSLEIIVSTLTRLGDFLRLAGFEGCPLIEEYYKISTEIARGKPSVEMVYQKIKHLWPAALNPLTLHYGKAKFGPTKLKTYESDEFYQVTAPLKNYRFNPAEQWTVETASDSDGDVQIATPKTPTGKGPKRNLYLDKIQSEMENYPSTSSKQPLLDEILSKMKK